MRKVLKTIVAALLWVGTKVGKMLLILLLLTPFLLPVIAGHEFGHYLALHHFGVPVAEVSVGIGWKIWCAQHAGTRWCLRLVPIGGYIAPTWEGSVMIKEMPVSSQIVIWIAGIAANLLTVVVLAAILQWWYERPSLLQLIGYTLKTAMRLPPAFLGCAFMVVTSFVTMLVPSFRPKLPFNAMVVLPKGAKKSLIRGWLIFALVMGLMNLLPFYPFDGGLILDALIPLVTSSHAVRTFIQYTGIWLALLVIIFGGRGRDDFNFVRYEGEDDEESEKT